METRKRLEAAEKQYALLLLLKNYNGDLAALIEKNGEALRILKGGTDNGKQER